MGLGRGLGKSWVLGERSGGRDIYRSRWCADAVGVAEPMPCEVQFFITLRWCKRVDVAGVACILPVLESSSLFKACVTP